MSIALRLFKTNSLCHKTSNAFKFVWSFLQIEKYTLSAINPLTQPPSNFLCSSNFHYSLRQYNMSPSPNKVPYTTWLSTASISSISSKLAPYSMATASLLRLHMGSQWAVWKAKEMYIKEIPFTSDCLLLTFSKVERVLLTKTMLLWPYQVKAKCSTLLPLSFVYTSIYRVLRFQPPRGQHQYKSPRVNRQSITFEFCTSEVYPCFQSANASFWTFWNM